MTSMLWIVGVLVGAGAALVAVGAAVYVHAKMARGRGAAKGVDARAHAVASDAAEIVELLARRMDDKATELEEVLAEADRKIVRLRTLLREREMEVKPAGRGGGTAPAELGPSPAEVTKEVYRLADAGRTVLDIARAVNQPTGHVELMLALRKV